MIQYFYFPFLITLTLLGIAPLSILLQKYKQ